MRIRIAELMASRGLTTGYQLARYSEGRIKLRTAHALVKRDGRLTQFSGPLLETLCDVFGVRDLNKLLERD